jgi:hypothetical protein
MFISKAVADLILLVLRPMVIFLFIFCISSFLMVPNILPVPIGDHTGLQQNHIWTPEELDEKMHTLYRHTPKTWSDRIVNSVVYFTVLNFL